MKKVTKKTRIFDSLVKEFPSNEFRYTDVIRTSYELSYGYGTYTSKNRGYYAVNMAEGGKSIFGFFVKKGYLRKPGRDPRYLVKNDNGTYSITSTY